MESHNPSVVCTVPGSAHKARNCTSELCQSRGLCQGTTTVKQVVSIAETAKQMEREGAFERNPLLDRQVDTTMQWEPPTKQVTAMLPTDKQERKNMPVVTGVLDYFSAAIAEIAKVSQAGNKQHNLGPLHWARGVSTDHADCIGRHLMERGTIDTDGMRHSAKMAWRALALLQQELEDAGAPMSRASKATP